METFSGPTLYIDFERHAALLAKEGCSPEQIKTSLEALWAFACAMVDFGFGIHPVQQACGKESALSPSETMSRQSEVYLPLSQFIAKDLAGVTAPEKEEA